MVRIIAVVIMTCALLLIYGYLLLPLLWLAARYIFRGITKILIYILCPLYILGAKISHKMWLGKYDEEDFDD